MGTRKLALALALERETLSAGELAREARVSRQAAHRHLRQLVRAGELVPAGRGRSARYLPPRDGIALEITSAPDEAAARRRVFEALPALSRLPRPAEELVEHAVGELVANALEYAAAQPARLELTLSPLRVRISVEDAGPGAFELIRRARGLRSVFEAVLELAKGPVTSAPLRHRGESLWFMLSTADRFELAANGLRLWVEASAGRSGIDNASNAGTRVLVELRRDSTRRVRDVLDEVTHERAFDRTRVAVRLFSLGTRLLSRADADLVLRGLERMSEVVLDFSGVEAILPSFADQMFRVWPATHPTTRLVPTQMADDVAFVVRRALLPG